MDLEAREAELRAVAGARGVDWEGRLSGFPDDRRLRIAALATLLEIDPIEALKADTPAERLDADARESQRERAEYERKERKYLRGLGLDVREER